MPRSKDPDFTPVHTWLHLSDIHTGHGGAWHSADQQLVLEEISRDVLARAAQDIPKFDSIFVTGDVAATGAVRSRDEFRRFDKWLAEILDKTGTDPAEVFAVPGNHDVQREVSSDPHKREIARLRRGDKIDEALEDTRLRAILRKRQARFQRWARPYGSMSAAEVRDFAWRHCRELPGGLRLRLVGLDTALLCANDDDDGKLEVGSKQILHGLGNPHDGDRELVVVLGHHPLAWLRDQLYAEGWIRQRAQVYLCGHVHRAGSEQVLGGSGVGLVTVAAGAVHEPVASSRSHPRHGYNVSSVGWRSDGELVLRVWSRIWAGNDSRFCDNTSARPEGQAYAEHMLDCPSGLSRVPSRSVERRPRGSTGAGRSSRVTVEQLAEIVHRDAGTRRTAYPSDLSFAELLEQDLHVPPRFGGGSSVEDIPKLAAALAGGDHALVLGDPGAGKSFASFMVLDELSKLGSAALTVDLGELPRPASKGQSRRLSRSAVLRSVAKRLSGSSSTVADDHQPLVLIVDGIDELLNTGQDADEIARDLTLLARRGTLLVTCRIREYRDMLATRISGMKMVATMRPWDFASEFSLFVGKLAKAERLSDPDKVLDLVGNTPDLLRLVSRPLYARMLTFVMETGGGEVTDRPSLYRTYLTHLSGATVTSLRRAGCEEHDVYEHWREAMWWMFSNRLVTEEGTPFTPLLSHLSEKGVDPACAIRMFSTLVDTVQVFDELRARFLHFSFFEYLVGEEAARRLRENAGDEAPLGTVDLTIEMRHFMMWISNRTAPSDLGNRLVESYRASSQLPLPERLVVNNLLAYVLGRMQEPQGRALRELLAKEDHPMLLTSLHWALSGAGDEEALSDYVEVLRSDRSMADLNRGYLRYYYGDLSQRQDPPYVDDEPYGPWASTRRRTIEMMSELEYAQTVKPARRLLDVETFVDFLKTRGEDPDQEEKQVLAAVLEGARSRLETQTALALVEDLLHRVGGIQLSLSL